MNNNYGTAQKPAIRTKSIVGAVGAIVCSIGALCSTFFPIFSSEKAAKFYELWAFGDKGKYVLDSMGDAMKAAEKIGGNTLSALVFEILSVYAATAAFFALVLAVIFVAVGKLTGLRTGKKALAGAFSIIALVVTAFFFCALIGYVTACNSITKSDLDLTYGPSLMLFFAIGTVVFSFIGAKGTPAGKAPAQAVPQQGAYNQYQNVPPAAPVPPQYPAPVQNPVQPQYPPQMMPQQQFVPVQPSAPDIDDDPPTVAQVGALEGIRGDYASAVINMKPGEKLIIGRDPTCCNIVISSEKRDISRTHCSVKYDPYTDSFKVIDMSSNGTYVNGTRLVRDQETQFPAGTIISLGSGENQFRLKK